MTRTVRILAFASTVLAVAGVLAIAGACCIETADACHASGRHADRVTYIGRPDVAHSLALAPVAATGALPAVVARVRPVTDPLEPASTGLGAGLPLRI